MVVRIFPSKRRRSGDDRPRRLSEEIKAPTWYDAQKEPWEAGGLFHGQAPGVKGRANGRPALWRDLLGSLGGEKLIKGGQAAEAGELSVRDDLLDRKSTRLNS